MKLENIKQDKSINYINVVIEIPANSAPVKYELDKNYEAIVVDRFLSAPMYYPANYGFLPNTLSDDGDPLDALVITPYPLLTGSIIKARVVGILLMEDEAGNDAKLIAVPDKKLTTLYDDIKTVDDLPILLREQIKHFFTNYKTVDKNKWTKVKGWGTKEEANHQVTESIINFKN